MPSQSAIGGRSAQRSHERAVELVALPSAAFLVEFMGRLADLGFELLLRSLRWLAVSLGDLDSWGNCVFSPATLLAEVGGTVTFGRPKSRILAWPRLVTNMFAGLMSRCTIP